MTDKKRIAAYALITVVSANTTTASEPASGEIEEVMVTASRVEKPLSTIPNTVTVIDTAALQDQLAIHNDISTVLGNLIPSFSPSRQKMTNAGESLRGRKPLYMIDGIPQSSPLREGGRDGHIIDSSVLSRVEVLHGANAIHGLGASGGIINLITKRPAATFQQSFNVDGTFQTQSVRESGDYGINYSLSNRFGNADVIASLGFRDSGISYDANGEVIGADNTQGDTMDSQTRNAFLKTGLGGANIAPDRANASWDRNWSKSVTSRVQVNRLLNRNFENISGASVARFDGYTTVDVSTDLQAFTGVITAAVQNLTNEDYFTYYSQTNPLDVRNFKGLGRTFRLNYRASF